MNQREGRKVNPIFVTIKRADTSRVGSAIVGVFMFVILFVGGLSPARAQPLARVTAPQQHAWYNYFGNHPVSKRWGLHLEGQWRREGFGQQPMQLLLRPGVNFYLTRNVTLTGGYGFIQTHQYGEYPAVAAFPEHRVWQQALMRQKLGTKAVMQHRYRLEQRNIGQMQVVPGQEPRRWTVDADKTAEPALPQGLPRQGFPRKVGRQDTAERTVAGGERAYRVRPLGG